MSGFLQQNAVTALITLLVVSLGFFLLEQYYFTHARSATIRVPVPAPVLTPIIPLGLHSPIQKFPVFMVYQQNLTMLQHAFDSAQEAFPNQVVIIDNSESLDLATNPDFKAAAAIWHTAIYLSFPQVHNTMAALAAAWGFDLYAWMHADAVVLKTESALDLGDLVLKILEPLGMSWAVAFTAYDVLAFYNTRVVLKEPWDEDFLQNYIADCDAYARWRISGHVQMELRNFQRLLKVVHLADVPPKRWDQMAPSQRWRVYPPLDKANQPANLDRNQWKWSSSSQRSMSTQKHRFDAAAAYYLDKWNTTECAVPLSARPAFRVPPSIMHMAMGGGGVGSEEEGTGVDAGP